jgi:glucose-6-phosphate isomerase
MPAGFRRKRARGEDRVRVDGNGVTRGMLGDAGLADDELARLGHELDERAEGFVRQRRIGFAGPPAGKTDLRKTIELAEQVRGAFEDVVVLGSGSLVLGIRALVDAFRWRSPDAEAPPSRARLHVADRLDPERFAALLARLDVRRTLFAVIAGRDDALVTMSHFLIVRDRLLRELGAVAYQQHVVIAADPSEGPLRQIVNDEGFRDLPLPHGSEDPFVLLTAPALFPVACAGLDVAEIAAGATDMATRCRARGEEPNPARLLATALLHSAHAGVRVVTPASTALRPLAAWIERRCAGLCVGERPMRAAPLTIILATARPEHDVTLPTAYQDLESVAHLGGRSLAALGEHATAAVELAHWSAGRPTLTLRCPPITAHALGQLVQLVETAAALARDGAAPDTRDDATIRFTHGLAGRPGFEAERAEAQRLAAKREDRYVV